MHLTTTTVLLCIYRKQPVDTQNCSLSSSMSLYIFLYFLLLFVLPCRRRTWLVFSLPPNNLINIYTTLTSHVVTSCQHLYTIRTQCLMVCHTAYRHCLLLRVYTNLPSIRSIVSSMHRHILFPCSIRSYIRGNSKIYTIFKFVVKFLFTSACGFMFRSSNVIWKCHNTFSKHFVPHLMTFCVVEYVNTHDGLPITHMFDLSPSTSDTL